jgi:hypothetical protein
MPRPIARERSDPAAVRRMIDSIFEATSPDAKQSYCEFPAASIAYLSQHHADRWGVTLREYGVRLNAGWVESLILRQGRPLRVLVERKSAPPGASSDGSRYRYAPGCTTVALPLSDLPLSLTKFIESHHEALRIAAEKRPPPRNIREAHSPGVTEWLSQVLHRAVPNPARPRRGEIDLDEALRAARWRVPAKPGTAIYRRASAKIRQYVLERAAGRCEGCGAPAPFRGKDGRPFLETHHTTRLADDGPDDPRKVIGICPNCHKRAHLAEDAKSFNRLLINKLRILQSGL